MTSVLDVRGRDHRAGRLLRTRPRTGITGAPKPARSPLRLIPTGGEDPLPWYRAWVVFALSAVVAVLAVSVFDDDFVTPT